MPQSCEKFNLACSAACEIRVTECCMVAMSTAFTTDVPLANFSIFRYLQMRWRRDRSGNGGASGRKPARCSGPHGDPGSTAVRLEAFQLQNQGAGLCKPAPGTESAA